MRTDRRAVVASDAAGIDRRVCIHDEQCTKVTPVCDTYQSMWVRRAARWAGTTYRRGSSPMPARGRTDGFIGGQVRSDDWKLDEDRRRRERMGDR